MITEGTQTLLLEENSMEIEKQEKVHRVISWKYLEDAQNPQQPASISKLHRGNKDIIEIRKNVETEWSDKGVRTSESKVDQEEIKWEEAQNETGQIFDTLKAEPSFDRWFSHVTFNP